VFRQLGTTVGGQGYEHLVDGFCITCPRDMPHMDRLRAVPRVQTPVSMRSVQLLVARARCCVLT